MIYIHDVEEEIAKETSPMELAGVDVDDNLGVRVNQPVLALPVVAEGVVDLTEGLFPDIPEDAGVRPMLKAGDLRLIKDMAVCYMRVNGMTGAGTAPVQLMRRILRKV
jgi:hypothetical protein